MLNFCWPGVPGGQGHTCDHGCSRMLTSTQRGGGDCIPLSCNNLVMASVVAAAWARSRDHRAAHRWWERGGSAVHAARRAHLGTPRHTGNGQRRLGAAMVLVPACNFVHATCASTAVALCTVHLAFSDSCCSGVDSACIVVRVHACVCILLLVLATGD
jgi:hypothetical protein